MKQRALFHARRQELVARITEEYPTRSGVVLLFAGFESERYVFRQESSFYYLSGIEEPASALVIDLAGETTLYVPHFADSRAQWVHTDTSPQSCGVDKVELLGEAMRGYSFPLLSPMGYYKHLTEHIASLIKEQRTLFVLDAPGFKSVPEQKILLARLAQAVPGMTEALCDISPLVAAMRRKKSKYEIEQLYKAAEITMVAQQAAACAIADGKYEYEVQAALEYVFKESDATPSFPSIVGSGPASVVLHYTRNNRRMQNGDLVVIDIGAEYRYYCADITRTYPVSGTFTPRQREIYQLVLDTQEYIAGLARPGYWLSNKDQPEKSLHHLAVAFLAERGYAQYFTHGLGHFLGIDVHDVGDYGAPLAEGDVITIEPGVYLPEENLGVRIEDDYWVTSDSVLCLTEDLPKSVSAIEAMARAQFVGHEEE